MKGFTFSQLAVILLVVLGLVVSVLIAATQLSGTSSKISEIGGQVEVGTLYLGTECLARGGFCRAKTDCDKITDPDYEIVVGPLDTSDYTNEVLDCGPTGPKGSDVTKFCCKRKP